MVGPLIDYLGRKTGILFVNVPAIIGWLCITIQPSLMQLYIGRLLTGLACGLSSVPSTVYMAESSTAAQRGYLMTGTSIAISLGVAIVYILGLIFQVNIFYNKYGYLHNELLLNFSIPYFYVKL